ncbi:recombinase family protein [Rhodococcus sp. ACPA4]|uniref:recombinase family protein n=1 Tax=Rhodococcus sp. ACPA4 TaxID=2028571 RepID=UPI00211CD0C3|nr:recombinase family protein [Rhodococcus sp. ACPA4]
MSTLLGCARVSTADQNPTLQTDALTAAGYYKIWTDVASGSKDDRPQLAAVIEHLRPGDTLAVWRLDRLGRSLPHLLQTVAHLEAIGVGFTSLPEEINTTNSGGRLIFTIFGALAEFERNLLREGTFAGLEAAKRQGRTGGRPPVLHEKQKGNRPQDERCRRFHDRNSRHARSRLINPVPQRQLDGWCTALLNTECQKTTARDTKIAGHRAVVF